MNKQELKDMVAQLLSQMGQEPPVKGEIALTPEPVREKEKNKGSADSVADISQMDLRKLYMVDEPADPDRYRKMKEKTPARLGSGRAGARYKTLTMLRFRADHAAAQDAVFSQVPEDIISIQLAEIRRRQLGNSRMMPI